MNLMTNTPHDPTKDLPPAADLLRAIQASHPLTPRRSFTMAAKATIQKELTSLLNKATLALTRPTSKTSHIESMDALLDYPCTLPALDTKPPRRPPPGFAPPSLETIAFKKAKKEMYNGNPSRAFTSLTNHKQRSPLSAQDIILIQSLHPPAVTSVPDDAKPTSAELLRVITMDPSDIVTTIGLKTDGSACDAHLFTWELLRVLTATKAGELALCSFVNALATTSTTPHQRILVAKLAIHDKLKEGIKTGVRPTCTCSLFLTLTASTLLRLSLKRIITKLGPRQTAFIKNGNAIASLLVQIALGLSDDAVLYRLDQENAFNMPHRPPTLRKVRTLLPGLYPIVHYQYATTTPILLNGVIVAYSARGNRQGEGLSGVTYCSGNVGVLDTISAALGIFAYSDDTFVVVDRHLPLLSPSHPVSLVSAAFLSTGQTTNITKSEFVDPSPSSKTTFFGEHLANTVTAEAMTIRDIRELVSHRPILHRFSKNHPMEALLLLTSSWAARVRSLLTRNHAPLTTIKTLNDDFLDDLRSFTSIQELTWPMVMRKQADGGMGISPFANSHHHLTQSLLSTLPRTHAAILPPDHIQAFLRHHNRLNNTPTNTSLPDDELDPDAPLPALPSSTIFERHSAWISSTGTIMPYLPYVAALRIHLGLDTKPPLDNHAMDTFGSSIRNFYQAMHLFSIPLPKTLSPLAMSHIFDNNTPPRIQRMTHAPFATAIGLAALHRTNTNPHLVNLPPHLAHLPLPPPPVHQQVPPPVDAVRQVPPPVDAVRHVRPQNPYASALGLRLAPTLAPTLAPAPPANPYAKDQGRQRTTAHPAPLPPAAPLAVPPPDPPPPDPPPPPPTPPPPQKRPRNDDDHTDEALLKRRRNESDDDDDDDSVSDNTFALQENEPTPNSSNETTDDTIFIFTQQTPTGERERERAEEEEREKGEKEEEERGSRERKRRKGSERENGESESGDEERDREERESGQEEIDREESASDREEGESDGVDFEYD